MDRADITPTAMPRCPRRTQNDNRSPVDVATTLQTTEKATTSWETSCTTTSGSVNATQDGDVMERRDTNRPPSSRRITTKSGFLLDTFLVIIILFFFSSSCNEGDLPSQIFSFASRRSHCVSFHNTRLNFPIYFFKRSARNHKITTIK